MADKHAEPKEEDINSISSRLTKVVTEKADFIKYAALAVFAVLIIALAVVYYTRSANAARRAESENALYRAEYLASQHPDQNASETFAKMAKEYAGLPAGMRAQVMQFSQAFNAKDYAGAATAIRDFLKANPGSSFAPRAQLALGQTLLMQEKYPEAEAELRRLAGTRAPSTYAEAKFALAQTLERSAESVKDNAEEYKRRLGVAAEEYADIVGQARAISRRGYWPTAVLMASDYALVTLRDKLAGYDHKLPQGSNAAAPTSTAAALPSSLGAGDIEVPSGDPLATVKEEAEIDAEAAAKAAVDAVIEAMEKAPAPESETVAMPPEEPAAQVEEPKEESGKSE